MSKIGWYFVTQKIILSIDWLIFVFFQQNGYGTANEGTAAVTLIRNNGQYHPQTATIPMESGQNEATISSSNLNNPNSQSSTSVADDAFHCHNRGNEAPKIANVGNKRATRVLWLSVGVCLFFMVGKKE